MSLHVYLLFLQFIPTTLVANGPLVWEAEQQINSVSFDSPLSMTIKWCICLSIQLISKKTLPSPLQYINATIRLFKPLTTKPTVAEQFATFVEWQTKYGDFTSWLNIVYYSTITILQNLTMTGWLLITQDRAPASAPTYQCWLSVCNRCWDRPVHNLH